MKPQAVRIAESACVRIESQRSVRRSERKRSTRTYRSGRKSWCRMLAMSMGSNDLVYQLWVGAGKFETNVPHRPYSCDLEL